MLEKHSLDQQDILAANIAHVRSTIAAAAQRAGRQPGDITLVAVSKTKPIELIQMAYELGLTTFGENRVQEASQKAGAFHPPDIHWHMIGHLQSNKAGKVIGTFDCVHSVDSLHLAQILNQHAARAGLRLPILLQVNVSGEQSKEGMHPDETEEIARRIVQLPNLEVQGLMTIAPQVTDPEQVRPVFRALRQLRDTLRQKVVECSWPHLSMGMTDDYPVAIEEGATIVRVGRAIFGERASKGELHHETR